MHAGKHPCGVATTELKHRHAVRRVRSDVVHVVTSAKANTNRCHANFLQLLAQWVGSVFMGCQREGGRGERGEGDGVIEDSEGLGTVRVVSGRDEIESFTLSYEDVAYLLGALFR